MCFAQIRCHRCNVLGACVLTKDLGSLLRSLCPQLRGTSFGFLHLFPVFDSTLLALRTITCTIVPHTHGGHRFRNPIPCPYLLLTRKLCFRAPTRGRRKYVRKTELMQIMMDIKRCFKYSSISGVGFCPLVNTPLVQIDMHAANFEPHRLSSSSHPLILSITVTRRRRLLSVEHFRTCNKSHGKVCRPPEFLPNPLMRTLLTAAIPGSIPNLSK